LRTFIGVRPLISDLPEALKAAHAWLVEHNPNYRGQLAPADDKNKKKK